jgi:glycosyltransferase involved in cell wall biosynthesis
LFEYRVDTRLITPVAAKISLVRDSAWSRASYEKALAICNDFKPDLAHIHNFWMSWTPSVHAACRAAGVATVQTLHNFRLLCANGLFLRNGRPCEDCLQSTPLLGIARRCYRNSFLASASVVRMAHVNRTKSTWHSAVSAFITPGEHARSRFLAAGFPEERMFVKANVVPDLGLAPQVPSASRTLAYVGRISSEKGIEVLLKAWAMAKRPEGSRLLMIGGEQDPGKFSTNPPPEVTFVGHVEAAQIGYFLGQARAIVLPSLCYETFGNTVVEAFSRGRAALVSDIGALSSLVQDGETGFKFPPGDANALARSMETILNADAVSDDLGANARAAYAARYSEPANHDALIRIYQFALSAVEQVPA